MNKMMDEDFMKDEYTEQDMRNARKNPYAKMFTATDKLKIMLEAFIRENNWTREEAKKRINDILA